MTKTEKAQSNICGVSIANMQMEFRREFRDIYPDHIMCHLAVAVGPMHSFIGFAIANGYLVDPDKDVDILQTLFDELLEKGYQHSGC